MDGNYDIPIPEPPKTPEVDPASLDSLLSGMLGDPLCRMLGRLEESIEQQAPIWIKDCDPLCRELDKVEVSAGQLFPSIDPMSDGLRYALDRPEKELKNKLTAEPLHEILSRLEKEIERQPPMKPPEEVVPLSHDGFPKSDKQSHFTFVPSQKPGVTHRESLLPRQYSEPIHRMTGHNTGIRNSGNGFDWYCNMHRKWVSEDECDDCPDFEETDYEPEDKADKRCRHSFFSFSEDRDKGVNEHFELGDESDE